MKTFMKAKSPLFTTSLLLLTFMVIQSAGGLFIPNLYHDSAEIMASWHANDLITLFVAVPVFCLALYCSQRGSVFATYVWFSLLFYAFYNNCYYLFGASLNLFFLVYVAIFIASSVSILIVATHYHSLEVLSHFHGSTLLRIIVIMTLLVFGTVMTVMWVGEWLNFALYGIKPGIPGMEEGFGLVAAMDLTTQLPVMFAGAFLLWRGKSLGYLLSFISTISNTVYLLVLILFCPFAEKAGLPKAWDGLPLFASLFFLCLVSSVLFYQNTKKAVYSE